MVKEHNTENNGSNLQIKKDERLLQDYLGGDLAAFSTLYGKYKGGLFRYFLRQVGDHQIAEDLFQDCWSKVIEHASDYSSQAQFSTWLYTIARNRVIDRHRHLKVVEKVVDTSQSFEESERNGHSLLRHEDAGLDMLKKHELLKLCLQNLPHNLLDVFVLKEESNLTSVQISEVVDASHEATKSRLRYAYTKLRECITSKLSGHKTLGGHDEQTA